MTKEYDKVKKNGFSSHWMKKLWYVFSERGGNKNNGDKYREGAASVGDKSDIFAVWLSKLNFWRKWSQEGFFACPSPQLQVNIDKEISSVRSASLSLQILVLAHRWQKAHEIGCWDGLHPRLQTSAWANPLMFSALRFWENWGIKWGWGLCRPCLNPSQNCCFVLGQALCLSMIHGRYLQTCHLSSHHMMSLLLPFVELRGESKLWEELWVLYSQCQLAVC